jgi:hypothetical protein
MRYQPGPLVLGALTEDGREPGIGGPPMGKSMRCRLGRHRWETVKNSDGEKYQRSRCHRDRGFEGNDPSGRYGPPLTG